MMLAIAVIAMRLGAVAILRRRAHFQALADYHAEEPWAPCPDQRQLEFSYDLF
jgi:hypothetical protein